MGGDTDGDGYYGDGNMGVETWDKEQVMGTWMVMMGWGQS